MDPRHIFNRGALCTEPYCMYPAAYPQDTSWDVRMRVKQEVASGRWALEAGCALGCDKIRTLGAGHWDTGHWDTGHWEEDTGRRSLCAATCT